MLGWVLMECQWHRNRDETDICKSCGRAVCETCVGNDGLLLIGNQSDYSAVVQTDEHCMVSGSYDVADTIRWPDVAEKPFRITQYEPDDVEKVTCIVCDEPLEHGNTEYCKSCQELIKYGL
jgi:hypothetical protein